MAKKKKMDWEDFGVKRLAKMLDNLNIKDSIYAAAYIAAVILTYKTINDVALTANQIAFAINKFLGIEKRDKLPDYPAVDPYTLFQSMVVAYIILKIDASDIASAVSKVGSMLTSGGVSSVATPAEVIIG